METGPTPFGLVVLINERINPENLVPEKYVVLVFETILGSQEYWIPSAQADTLGRSIIAAGSGIIVPMSPEVMDYREKAGGDDG